MGDIMNIVGTPIEGLTQNGGKTFLTDEECFKRLFENKPNLSFSTDLKRRVDRFVGSNPDIIIGKSKIFRHKFIGGASHLVGRLMIELAKLYCNETLSSISQDLNQQLENDLISHECYMSFFDELSKLTHLPIVIVITNFYEEIENISEEDAHWLVEMLERCRNVKLWICADGRWYDGKKSIYEDLYRMFDPISFNFFEDAQCCRTLPYVYVSYNWMTECDKIADEFCDKAKLNHLPYRRDKVHIRYRDSITDFMNQLRVGKYVVVILSKEYLEAFNCMYELTGIMEHEDFRDRIFPIVLNDSIRDDDYYDKLLKHWENKANDEVYLNALKDTTGASFPLQRKKALMDQFYKTLPTIKDYLKEINSGSFVNLRNGDYHTIIDQIVDKINIRIR